MLVPHTDTHRESEQVQIELMRQAGSARRFALASSLTHAAIYHAKRAVARSHPAMPERDRDMLFLESQYGAELASAVHRYLDSHKEFRA